jgi:glycosyltransferase involved in cell wall biosynthesis
MITSDQVTVVIPCFNSRGYVTRAVESVLNQTSKPGKILLVDDDSNDGTFDLLLQIQRGNLHQNIVIVKNFHNLGPGLSRNHGWDMSETDWIAFLDADDAWHPRKLEIQIQVLNENPDLTMICTQTKYTDSTEKEIENVENFALTRLSFQDLLFKNVVPTRSVLLRREITLRFPSGLSEDYALWLEALHLGMHFGKVEAPLTFHFRKDFSAGGVSSALLKHELFELKRLSRYLSNYPIRTSLAILFSLLKFIRRVLIRFLRMR